LIKEDHLLKGNTEETQRSYYQPDINGKMAAQAVENETVVRISAKEKQLTRAATGRPDGSLHSMRSKRATKKTHRYADSQGK
jgi:hypothetical protein